jgi:hypothetical protein
MGMTVFSGMLAATVIGVVVVPALYVVAARLAGDKKSTGPGAGSGGGAGHAG